MFGYLGFSGPYFCAKYPFLFIQIIYIIIQSACSSFLPPTRAIAKARGPKNRSEMDVKISRSNIIYCGEVLTYNRVFVLILKTTIRQTALWDFSDFSEKWRKLPLLITLSNSVHSRAQQTGSL